METHPLIGDELLASLELLAAVRPVVRHHHERWDGTGYPDRLAGEAIPLAARVVALADSVEAMSGERTYRVPLTCDAIVRELQVGSGNQWEPRLVDIVLDLIRSGALSFTESGLVLSETTEEVERSRAVAVLLVEDDQLHAMMAKSALEKAIGNAVVTHAPNAASALDLCRGASFSLIVLDHNLPDGSGVDLVETLHTLAPDVPVVMLTGEGSESVAIEAFRHGVADYVVKSKGFLEELTGRVRALVAA
jgi:response regulator RpfG family c-di-GMP phosphodiesterase